MSSDDLQRAMVYASSVSGGPLRQCEILSDLVLPRVVPGTISSEEGPVVESVSHPFAVVVSQDCDLDLDFKAREGQVASDKLLPNVLFCEATTAERLKGQLDRTDLWRRIKDNRDERYQFLQRVDAVDDTIREGIPELAIDFKRYFAVATEEVYLQLSSIIRRRCRLVSPYLEHLSSRFANYQSRVALPEGHQSEPMR